MWFSLNTLTIQEKLWLQRLQFDFIAQFLKVRKEMKIRENQINGVNQWCVVMV